MTPHPPPAADTNKETRDSSNNNEDTDSEDYESLLLQRSLPVISLTAGLQKKASAFDPESWIKLSLSLDGRDKITKFLQYVGRFMAFYLQGSDASTKWNSLYKHLSASRKGFRLGRSCVELDKLQKMSLFLILSDKTRKQRVWKTVCSALKLLGTCGFWFADNLNFLTSAGVFDDLSSSTKEECMLQRKVRQERYTIWSNQSYFYGSFAGLLVNLDTYFSHRHSTLRAAVQQRQAATTKEEVERAEGVLRKAKEDQFSHLVMLVKSFCDVLVFSNNAGIDWFLKWRGQKLHEGVHCVGGMLSAAAILYHQYPNYVGATSNK